MGSGGRLPFGLFGVALAPGASLCLYLWAETESKVKSLFFV